MDVERHGGREDLRGPPRPGRHDRTRPADHPAALAVAQIGGGPDGQAQLLAESGPHSIVTGEYWFVVVPQLDKNGADRLTALADNPDLDHRSRVEAAKALVEVEGHQEAGAALLERLIDPGQDTV
ncbi:hypothetical protein ACFC6L_22700 [Kitasatospora phosalacinea]|uniref:hypothetical protein n=1 Tax=Kitasatospora phosalacinea TaxID=2065 RepID=UPI0035D6F335